MKSVEKFISVLDLFLEGNGELSVDNIARLSGLKKSAARRITNSLVECGFLRQPKKGGKYSLGMRFLDFSKAVKQHHPILEIAEPFLNQFSRRVDETVSLALWDGKRAVICQSNHPNHPLKVVSYEGTMLGLHYNSIGKAILAELTEDALNALLPQELPRYTPKTITSLEDLKKELKNVRKSGVAIDDEEGFTDVRGLASVFKNEEGQVVGALNVMGPSSRLNRDRTKEIIPILKEYAEKISSELGYTER